jgi:hypothetical protein
MLPPLLHSFSQATVQWLAPILISRGHFLFEHRDTNRCARPVLEENCRADISLSHFIADE